MNILEFLLQELDQEAVTTRKMLSRVPDDKFGWQPHPKSMTVKTLATHIAELPSWIGMTLETDELNFAENPYQPKDLKTNLELLEYFESILKEGRVKLKNAEVDKLSKDWTLRDGDTIFQTTPKLDVIRMTFSQIIHHRAQLGVYLRLLDIPIPGSYGPSADEGFMGT